MINNIFFRLFKNSDSLAELFRTYLVGAFNLIFGLFLAYIFQFIILTFVDFPLRIYLTNIFGFMISICLVMKGRYLFISLSVGFLFSGGR